MIIMYISIVKVENNRITKYARFDNEQKAQSHCEIYGGFVYEGEWSPDLFVDGDTVTIQPVTESPEQAIERLKAELKAIEREEIMPRKTREIQIRLMEFLAAQEGITPEQLAQNPAYAGMKETDAQCAALRQQIKDLAP